MGGASLGPGLTQTCVDSLIHLDAFGFTSIRLVSLGVTGIHLDSFGLPWIHLDSGIHLDSLWFIWIHLDSFESAWFRLDSLGFT